MRRTGIGIVVVAFLLGTVLTAGVRAKGNQPQGGGGYFSLGENWVSLSNLNTILARACYSKLRSNGLAFGGGGFAVKRRWLWGGMGAGFNNGSTTANGNKVAFGGGYGLFDLGYMILNTPKMALYPMIGIGGGGLTLKITRQSGPKELSDLLKNPEGEVQITSGDFLLNVGFGFHFLLAKKEKRGKGTGGLLVGARAGYLVSLIHGNWRMEQGDVPGAPKSPFTGPYVYITIGGMGKDGK